MKLISLSKISEGVKGIIIENKSSYETYRRFLDIGIVKGASVECIGESPLKDPVALYVNGAVMAVRRKDLSDITMAVDENE